MCSSCTQPLSSITASKDHQRSKSELESSGRWEAFAPHRINLWLSRFAVSIKRNLKKFQKTQPFVWVPDTTLSGWLHEWDSYVITVCTRVPLLSTPKNIFLFPDLGLPPTAQASSSQYIMVLLAHASNVVWCGCIMFNLACCHMCAIPCLVWSSLLKNQGTTGMIIWRYIFTVDVYCCKPCTCHDVVGYFTGSFKESHQASKCSVLSHRPCG